MPPKRSRQSIPDRDGGGDATGVDGEPWKSRFPVARIKKIMQADDDVGKVSQVVPVAISRALELFMQMVVVESAKKATETGGRKVTLAHLRAAVESTPSFDFLEDQVKEFPKLTLPSAEGSQGPTATTPTVSTATAAPKANPAPQAKGVSGTESGEPARRGRKPGEKATQARAKAASAVANNGSSTRLTEQARDDGDRSATVVKSGYSLHSAVPAPPSIGPANGGEQMQSGSIMSPKALHAQPSPSLAQVSMPALQQQQQQQQHLSSSTGGARRTVNEDYDDDEEEDDDDRDDVAVAKQANEGEPAAKKLREH